MRRLLIFTCVVALAIGQRFPSRKTWWAKYITDDLYVAGLLTEKQFKFAYESGFTSFIALHNVTERTYIGPGEVDPLPTTAEAADLVRGIGGDFRTVLPAGSAAGWDTEDALGTFSEQFAAARKPVLFYGGNGHGVTFLALMHYFNQSRHDDTAEPRMNGTDVFLRAAVLGYSFATDAAARALVNQVAGELMEWPDELIKANVSLPDWQVLPAMWQIKPLYGNLFVSGQVQSNHLPLIRDTGYDLLVNLRRGVKVRDLPYQEEVILLNIRDRTGTYDAERNPVRQTPAVLERNRISPGLPNTYISPDSTVNYESRNPLQFGDHIGYNETIERQAVEEIGLPYLHTPVGGVYTYGIGLWEAYRDVLMNATRSNGAVLLQCRTGYRSAVLGMLMYGCHHGFNSSQVLERAFQIGYRFEADRERAVVQLVKDVLDNREVQCPPPPHAPSLPPAPPADGGNGDGPISGSTNHKSSLFISRALCLLTVLYAVMHL